MALAMPAAPQIVVAIPARAAAATIGEAVQSVLAQSFSNWRLAVYENAAVDNTAEIVRAFADPRVVVKTSPAALSFRDNWQRCLQDLDGDFFQLLCADDKLHPHCFEQKLRLAQQPQNADIAVFSSNRRLLSAGGGALFEQGFAKRGGRHPRARVLRQAAWRGNPVGDPSVMLFRAAALRDFEFDKAVCPFMADADMWDFALQRGDLLHLPRALSDFRVHLAANSGSRFWQNTATALRFYRRRVRPHLQGGAFLRRAAPALLTTRAVARHLVYLCNR